MKDEDIKNAFVQALNQLIARQPRQSHLLQIFDSMFDTSRMEEQALSLIHI